MGRSAVSFVITPHPKPTPQKQIRCRDHGGERTDRTRGSASLGIGARTAGLVDQSLRGSGAAVPVEVHTLQPRHLLASERSAIPTGLLSHYWMMKLTVQHSLYPDAMGLRTSIQRRARAHRTPSGSG